MNNFYKFTNKNTFLGYFYDADSLNSANAIDKK